MEGGATASGSFRIMLFQIVIKHQKILFLVELRFRIMLFQIVIKPTYDELSIISEFQNYVILDSNKTLFCDIDDVKLVLELCYFRQ